MSDSVETAPDAPKWQKILWSRLSQGAMASGKEPAFRIFWHGKEQYFFDVVLVGEQPKVRVTPEVLKMLDSIDGPKLIARLQDDAQREAWQRRSAKIRKATNTTVTLSIAVCNIMTPLAAPDRGTLNLNIYQALDVDVPGFADLLGKEGAPLQALGKRATLRSIGGVLNILTPNSENDTIIPLPDTKEDADADSGAEDDEDVGARNVIVFGPPGTGKSFRVNQLVREHLGVKEPYRYRITFHPEMTYFDFVGTYRPTVGWHAGPIVKDARGEDLKGDPRVYYAFEPGPFSLAVVAAIQKPDENVVLIIEEINRGNCAAIFGDVFQLLDRVSDESMDKSMDTYTSQYEIMPSSEWAAWLSHELASTKSRVWTNRRLRLPANLFIYATMNTSDQSLFPMDTAFRRRWTMEYVGIDAAVELKTLVPLHAGDSDGVLWRELMKPLNEEIVNHTRSDDKQMGPYFITPTRTRVLVGPNEFRSKVLFYLWSDVFRDQPDAVFVEDIRTYDQLIQRYDSGKQVFAKKIVERVKQSTTQAPVPLSPEQSPAPLQPTAA